MPSTPELKTIKPLTFLLHRTEATVAELVSLASIGQQLYKEAVEKNLDISGPIHWHYFNFEGEHKPFTLEIALPVNKSLSDYDGPFHFKRTEEFQCACLTHEGRWDDLPKSYDTLIKFVTGKGKAPSTNAREIYVHADFHDQETNVTEIQLGIQ